ncbi:MAG: carotenoid 1,2-hydratase [Burkholderiales bacterium]|nr:carotenoid 1,2-hydratase [Burkholderiales bacterium]MCA3251931.1 carotenoid 1,2-hydratase [Rubrivivax sp.]MCA3257310.1 carotenoid 1,2-hydratase [Rubrivivax sp.]MCZ8031800.1 carotenoid 1,2-hydratase [Rubrivivax sp.]
MQPLRRWLLALAASAAAGRASGATPGAAPGTAPAGADDDTVRRGRALRFPRDHGAHPGTRTEWWYATGWLGRPDVPTHGVQVTFFRSRTGVARTSRSRFAARHVLFAHAAITDLEARTHWHAQRIARWSGDPDARPDFARLDDAELHIGRWWIRREPHGHGATWRARVDDGGTALELALGRSQPLLLQGDAGFSRKSPVEEHASHYYSEPQLEARAAIERDGRRVVGTGRAWLDHEWSEALLHPEAVGWDWIGMNLFDGGALTAFVLRRADGSTLWGGGSLRTPDGVLRTFAAREVRFEAGRRWTSPATRARYPVTWRIGAPGGPYEVRALLDAQELGGTGSGGTIYWEGVSELLDAAGRRIGLGYLEMTGYAGPLRLG